MQIDREELVWAAGFFDGEGWTGLAKSSKARRFGLRMAVSQVNRDTLQRFQDAVGGLGKIRGPYTRTSPWRPMYRWHAETFETAQAVIAMLWFKLSEPKKQQAFKALVSLQSQRVEASRTCKNGHQRTAANTRYRANGSPRCSECRRITG